MIFPVMFKVSRILVKPFSEPRIVIAIVAGISLSPTPVVLRLQGPFTRRFSTDFLAVANFWVRGERGLAIGAFFHPGPPLQKRNYSTQINQKTKMNKDESKGKNQTFLSFSQLEEL
jgi:hypothetical protein